MPKLQGPLRLYNMFPRGFKDFVAMKEYVVAVAEMGFNAIWINPLQEVTELGVQRKFGARNTIPIDEKAYGSVYAAKSLERLNKEFIRYDEDDSEAEIQRKGKEQLKALVAEIKKHNMVPIFDLVLNHVAADSDEVWRYENRGFFKEGCVSYYDVRDFNYAEHQDEIIAEIWKGYIEKYTKEYGFEGVRVDAPFLFSLHKTPEVRKKIYQVLCANIDDPIIFEEWLFSDLDVPTIVQDLLLDNDSIPTHITTSLAFAECGIEKGKYIIRETPEDYRNEVRAKERIVFIRRDGSVKNSQRGGVINFTGCHDSYSLKGETLGEMALRQMYNNEDLKWLRTLYDALILKLEDPAIKASPHHHDLLMMSEAIVFGVMKEINDSPEDFDLNEELIEFKLKERLVVNALTGGGGFYLLAGDESGDIKEQALFAFKADAKAASDETEEEFDAFLESIAEFVQAAPAEDDHIVKRIIQNIEDLKGQEREFCNFGEGALSGTNDLRGFIREINHILSKMPEGKFGHFSEELFLKDKPWFVIIARTNGSNFKIPNKNDDPISQCDLIIVNVVSEKNTELSEDDLKITDNDLEKIYMQFEKKVGVPYDGSYNHIKKANLHLGSGIKNTSIKQAVGQEAVPLALQASSATSLQVNFAQELHQ